MRHRRLGSLGTLVIAIALVSIVAAYGPAGTSAFVAAAKAAEARQVNTSPSDSYSVPKTPWGHPDLQGLWNNSTNTPLERMTADEQERGRAAQRPVREATDGTGAAWPETAGPIDRAFLVVDPPDGRIPMKPEAIQRLVAREEARRGRGEADSWLDRNSWERCISRTLPVAMIPNLYNNNYQILQTPDHVVIQMEMIHEARIIPLDGRPHASERIRQWLGDSRGHWEGTTLVVETINFNDKLDGGDLQPSHVIQTGHRGSGKTLRLVERFRRINADTIDYRFTVEDPATFTRPYTVAIPMRKTPSDTRLYEYACHEGNYAMLNILRGGRADEQAAMEGALRVSRQRIEAGHPGIREPAVPIVPAPRR
jgi:hypothetical protein